MQKICAQFIACISEIYNTQVENAKKPVCCDTDV